MEEIEMVRGYALDLARMVLSIVEVGKRSPMSMIAQREEACRATDHQHWQVIAATTQV